jgi:hypothetical protein
MCAAGIPTVSIDGWRYNGLPRFAEFEQVPGRVAEG